MSDILDNITFDHDEERETFDAIIGNQRATMEYRANKEGKIFLTHTEVPENLQGQGVAEKLILHVFDYVRKNNLKIIPVCPFVKAYLKKHTEYLDLVASGIRVT